MTNLWTAERGKQTLFSHTLRLSTPKFNSSQPLLACSNDYRSASGHRLALAKGMTGVCMKTKRKLELDAKYPILACLDTACDLARWINATMDGAIDSCLSDWLGKQSTKAMFSVRVNGKEGKGRWERAGKVGVMIFTPIQKTDLASPPVVWRSAFQRKCELDWIGDVGMVGGGWGRVKKRGWAGSWWLLQALAVSLKWRQSGILRGGKYWLFY